MGLREVIKKQDIELIDVRYISLDSRLRSVSFPVERLDSFLDKGIGIDGSSIGLRDEEHSDMLLKPDVNRYYIDPTSTIPTIILFGRLYDEKLENRFEGDPYYILENTVSLLKERGIVDEILVQPELEFYLFEDCYFEDTPLLSIVDITPGNHRSADNSYHADYPLDSFKDFRNNLVSVFQRMGIQVKYGHHEGGRFGQHEIELSKTSPVQAMDNILLCKYIIQRLSSERRLVATFMPKPIEKEPGNGLHLHLLLRLKGKSIFYDASAPEHLSGIFHSFVSGILQHGRAISAFTNPSTNSYKRLMSGFEAPNKLFYSVGSRASAIRIPGYNSGKEHVDIEYRPPDASCNPCLALSSILLGGLDGVEKGMKETTWNKNEIEELPYNLLDAQYALEADRDFLTEDGIFPEEIIERWIDKKKKEFWQIINKPSPIEYNRYFQI